MPFSINHYAQLRPFLYHLTAQANQLRIQSLQRLESAALLFVTANRADALRERRRGHLHIPIDGHQIVVRDQAPLHAGNIAFADGWGLPDLIADLNRRVFFWPGTGAKPIEYGMRHFARYEAEEPLIIRVRFVDLLRHNPNQEPMFCRYNSGSPRYNNGRASPRGQDTFQPAERCAYRPSAVVETTFVDSVNLPATTECADSPIGPWRPLFSVD
jgi:hypothetical protein